MNSDSILTRAEIFLVTITSMAAMGPVHLPIKSYRKVFFSEIKQPQRETRILNALPPDTYTHNTVTITLHPHQAQNAGNFGRYLYVLSVLLAA